VGLVEITEDGRAVLFGALWPVRQRSAADGAKRRLRCGGDAEDARSLKAAPGLVIPAPDRSVNR
jgi:hypothetical protein